MRTYLNNLLSIKCVYLCIFQQDLDVKIPTFQINLNHLVFVYLFLTEWKQCRIKIVGSDGKQHHLKIVEIEALVNVFEMESVCIRSEDFFYFTTKYWITVRECKKLLCSYFLIWRGELRNCNQSTT